MNILKAFQSLIEDNASYSYSANQRRNSFQSLIEDNARQGVKKFIHFKISLFQSLIEDNARKQLNHMFLR